MSNVKNWLNYYKNSLTDSENLAVDISRIKNLFHQNYCDLSKATISAKNAAEMLDVEEKRINYTHTHVREIYLLSVLSIHPGGIGLSCLFVQHTHK